MRHTPLLCSRRLFFLALAGLCWLSGETALLEAQTSTAEPSAAESKWTIEGVLGMMDKAAQDFHTLTADLEHVKYTAVVKDTSTETGHIFVRHDDKMRIDITQPDALTILAPRAKTSRRATWCPSLAKKTSTTKRPWFWN